MTASPFIPPFVTASLPPADGPSPAAAGDRDDDRDRGPALDDPTRTLTDPLRRVASRWLAEGRRAAVVEIIETAGSAPRRAGTRLLVDATTSDGTIGGGHLEFRAIALARKALASNGREVAAGATPGAGCVAFVAFTRRFALGPSLGQCCGGQVTIRIAPLDAAAIDRWPALPTRFHLMLYGAGHVGQALVTVLATLPCSIDWIDDRELPPPAILATAFGPHSPGRCRWAPSDVPEADAATAPAGAAHLVMTHDHDLDWRLCRTILGDDRAGFVGLIGSRTKRARFTRRLADAGVDPARIARLQCPVGLPGITGREPAVIALAVAGQLLQWSSGPIASRAT